MKKISLSEALEGIEDTRRDRSVMYPLHEIFVEWMKNIAANIFGVIAVDGKEARRTKDKTTISHNYSIYSVKNMTASQFAVCKRGHWSVENSLHWALDMVFREDESRARADNSAENLNVFRQMAFNILKRETSFKGGISDKRFNCLLDERYLDKVLCNWLCS